MKFSFLSSNIPKLKINFLFPPLSSQRLFSSQSGKNLGDTHNDITADIDPSDTFTAVKADNEFINTDPTNESKVVSYKDLCKVENLELGLKRTKSGVSAGLDGEVKANYTTSKLEKLAGELKSHSYKPSPTKKVWIAKPDGEKRPLGISSQKDKIIQATLLNLLEPKLESIFLDSSMGFRPKRGTHNALHRIKRRWQNVT